MVYLSKNSSSLFKPKKKHIIFGSILFFFLLVIGFYFQVRREEKLKDSRYIKAIILKNSTAIKGGATIKYKVYNKEYTVKILNSGFRGLTKGDSIVIKVAKSDPVLIKFFAVVEARK